MKILFLDDEQYRHDYFDKKCVRHEIFHARTVPEAIKWLTEEKFDVISLDHDLGTAETGRDVSKFISEKMEWNFYPDYIILHSFNPVGARNMFSDLRSTGIHTIIAPFGKFFPS